VSHARSRPRGTELLIGGIVNVRTSRGVATYPRIVSSRLVIATAVAAVVCAFGVLPPAHSDSVTATVVGWSDGDTVVTTAGTVRLIGVNAPDAGACGYTKAAKVAAAVAPAGTSVTLTLPHAHDGADDYGRLLRYVGIGSTDIGLQQIKKGAQAKYDSTDGYDKHPRQKKYRQQDIKHRDYCARRDLASYQPVSANVCPKKAPIKGNRSDDWIYHLPSNQYYKQTNPEECFATEDGAKKAGYRAALV
jgi:endonuclease YncB( thermonuclease family)